MEASTIAEGGGDNFSLIYISSSWVNIMLYTKTQLSRLPTSTVVWCNCDWGGTPSLLTKDLVGV